MTSILVVLVALATAWRAAVPAVVPLSPWAGLLRSVTVTVDGTAHPFIFDTGGGQTVITPEVAAAVGCTPYGRAIGFRMSGERVEFEYCDNVALRLGQVALAREPVGVFDLKSILPAGLPRADGVLSLRSFRDSSGDDRARRGPVDARDGGQPCCAREADATLDDPDRDRSERCGDDCVRGRSRWRAARVVAARLRQWRPGARRPARRRDGGPEGG